MELEFVGDYTDCTKLREGGLPQQRYLRTDTSAAMSMTMNKSGALDRPTACRFTKSLCNPDVVQPMTQQQQAVRSEQGKRLDATFRSVETATQSQRNRLRQTQTARCARLIDRQHDK